MQNLSGLEAKEPLTDTGKVYIVSITCQAFPSCHCICMQRHRYSNHHIYICPVKKRHLVTRGMFSIMHQLLNFHVHWKCTKITCMILSLKNPLQTKFILLRLYVRYFQAARATVFLCKDTVIWCSSFISTLQIDLVSRRDVFTCASVIKLLMIHLFLRLKNPSQTQTKFIFYW